MEWLYTSVLALLSILISGNISKSSSGFSAKHNSKDANDIGAKYFENFKGNVLQRKYTIIVNQKTEDCYFVTELIPGRTFKVDFVVCKRY